MQLLKRRVDESQLTKVKLIGVVSGGLQGALVLYVSVQKEFSERQSDR